MKTSNAIDKDVVRQKILTLRNSLSNEFRTQSSDCICRSLWTLLDDQGYLDGRHISAYLPIRSEVDLTSLIQRLADSQLPLSLPVVLDRTTIAFRHYDPAIGIVDAGFGTSGPPDSASVVDPMVLLMPVAGFDRLGARIGYGAGHYDRALHRLRKKGLVPITIGVAFSVQEVQCVPSEAHDVPLDAIVTENEIVVTGELLK